MEISETYHFEGRNNAPRKKAAINDKAKLDTGEKKPVRPSKSSHQHCTHKTVRKKIRKSAFEMQRELTL